MIDNWRGKIVEILAKKVVAKGRGMVYNIWTYRGLVC
jgi:Holliday junction resolvasome RuvABC DNA-binding subunit